MGCCCSYCSHGLDKGNVVNSTKEISSFNTTFIVLHALVLTLQSSHQFSKDWFPIQGVALDWACQRSRVSLCILRVRGQVSLNYLIKRKEGLLPDGGWQSVESKMLKLWARLWPFEWSVGGNKVFASVSYEQWLPLWVLAKIQSALVWVCVCLVIWRNSR